MNFKPMMIEDSDSRKKFFKKGFHESDDKDWDRHDPTWRPKVSHIHQISFYKGTHGFFHAITGMSVRYKMTDGSISTEQFYGQKGSLETLTIDCTSTFLKKIEVWHNGRINGIQIHTNDGKPHFIGNRDGGRYRIFDAKSKRMRYFNTYVDGGGNGFLRDFDIYYTVFENKDCSYWDPAL